jgi:flagellar hook-length control protein FliK
MVGPKSSVMDSHTMAAERKAESSSVYGSRRQTQVGSADFQAILSMFAQVLPAQPVQPPTQPVRADKPVNDQSSRDVSRKEQFQAKDRSGDTNGKTASKDSDFNSEAKDNSQNVSAQTQDDKTADVSASAKAADDKVAEVSASANASDDKAADASASAQDNGAQTAAIESENSNSEKLIASLETAAQGGEVRPETFQDALVNILQSGTVDADALKTALQGKTSDQQIQTLIDTLKGQVSQANAEKTAMAADVNATATATTNQPLPTDPIRSVGDEMKTASDIVVSLSLPATEINKVKTADESKPDVVSGQEVRLKENTLNLLDPVLVKASAKQEPENADLGGDDTSTFAAVNAALNGSATSTDTADTTPDSHTGENISVSGMNGVNAVKTAAESQVASQGVAADSAAKSADTVKTEASSPLRSAQSVDEKKILQQIVDKLSSRSFSGKSEIHIRLDPPSLGTVRMSVSTVGDSVRATVVAENQAVKQTIESNLNQLRDAIANQGLKVESFTVVVGGDPGQKGFQQAGREAFQAGSPESLENSMKQKTEPPVMAAPRGRPLRDTSQSISVFA